jgi:hypothetical protein
MDQPPYTSTHFQEEVHRLLVSTASAALADSRLSHAQVAPFLEAGRALCRDDLRLNGRLALHGVEHDGTQLVETDEAYLSISVRGREDGTEWLSQTYWLSDLALADQDPERVRAAVAALERSIARLREWLAAREDPEAQAAGGTLEVPPAA